MDKLHTRFQTKTAQKPYPMGGGEGAHTCIVYIREYPPGSLYVSLKLPTYPSPKPTLGSLSSEVFERRTSTGNGLFAHLSRDFEHIFGQIVSTRIKPIGNTNTVASRLIKREKGSLPVDVRRSKTSLLKLPINTYFSLRAKCTRIRHHSGTAEPHS